MIKNRLSRILGERRMSQKKLAELTKLRTSTINAIFNERSTRIEYEVLDKICAALGCQPGDLLEFIANDSIGNNKE